MSRVPSATIAPGKVELHEFDRPSVGDGDMLVEIISAGICGSDKHAYLGHAKLEFPIAAGHEFVATVVEMGDGAEAASNIVGGPVQVGDRVAITPSTLGCGRCWFCQHAPQKPALCPNRMVYGFTPVSRPPHLTGAFASLMHLGPKSNVFRIPDGLSTDRAVLTEPMAVATRAVERALAPGIPHIGEGLSIGKRVAVLGAGPIGLLIVAALRHVGVGTIIVTDLSEARLAFAKRMGADLVIPIGSEDMADRVKTVQDATDGVGADVVIEAAGVPAAFEEALAMVRRGGTLIEIGHYFDSGTATVSPHTICQKDVDILGVWAYPPIQFETALAALARSTAPLEDLLTTTLPLASLEEGIEITGSEDVVKVLIDPRE
jgi:L-iditol 2-dehydrogenase